MTNLDTSDANTDRPRDQEDRTPLPKRRVAHMRHAQHHIAVAEQAERQYLAGGNRVTAGLGLFDEIRGQLDLARRRLQDNAGEPETDALLIADAGVTAHIGDLRYAQQAERIPQLEQALQAAQRTKDQAGQSICLGNLGLAYAALGNARKAIEFHQQDLALTRAIGDRRGEAGALGNLGLAYYALGDARQAIEFHSQALAISREIGDRRAERQALGALGVGYADLGDTQKAIEFYLQDLALARASGDRRGEAGALSNLGTAYYTLGDIREALDVHQQSLDLSRAIGDRQSEASALSGLGAAYFTLGDLHQAIELHSQALAISQEIGDRRAESYDLGNLGTIYFTLGDLHQAIKLHNQALAISREIGDQRGESHDLSSLGEVYAALGDTYQAIECYQQHLAIAHTIGDREGEAETRWNYGLALVRQGEVARALPLLEAALAFYQQIGHPDADSMANDVAHIHTHGMLPEQNDALDIPAELPEAVQDALNRQDHAALDAALAALPDRERAQVENLLVALNRHALEEAGRRSPEEVMAGLPPELRVALETGDQAGALAVLATLPEEQRQRAINDLSVLQTHAALATEQEQQRQQLEALVRDIAVVAVGDDGPREAVEAELAELEQEGWMLREPIARLWAGERDFDALVAGLDQQDSLLIKAVLLLATAYERGELRTPAQVLADLPEPVRAAVQNGDQAAFDTAFAALDEAGQAHVAVLLAELNGETKEEPEQPAVPVPDERSALLATLPAAVRAAIEHQDVPALQAALDTMPKAEASVMVEQLQRAGLVRTGPPPVAPRPGIDRVLEHLLPLLGDIALGALGDETARQTAEAMLPGFEEYGWQLADAARRIWAGERDAAALTQGLDAQDSALVQQTLQLIAGGRGPIGVAFSREIDRVRREADHAFAKTRASNAQEREALAADLETNADRAEERPGAPWQALAAHLRTLVAQLRLPHE